MPVKSNDLVPASEIGRVLGLTVRRVGQLAAEGIIPKASRGRFPLGRSVQGYVASAKAGRSVSAEAKRLAAAKARAAELHAARLENRLIEFDDVLAINAEILGVFRSELGGIPAAATRDLAVRASIEAALNSALDRCAARFDSAQADLRSGRDPLAIGDDD
jgi:phage terminase Nu1 subunit (DNA packaging protein)